MTQTQSFGSLQVAAGMRDAIIKIARKEIETLRPETKIAEVISINESQLTAEVQLAGDSGTFNARFGYSLMPRQAGDLVRVQGKVGNYFITEILNNSGAHAVYEPVVDAITDEDGKVDIPGAIPPGGVEHVHLGENAVGTDNIQALAVSEEEIADGAVTINKLSVVMGGGQMLDNSSFENVLAFMDKWTVSGTAPTRETSIVHGIGLAASRFSASTVAYQEVSGLEIGKVYSVTAYGWMSSGATIAPTMRVSDGTGGNSQDQVVTISGTWVRSVARYTANVTGKVRVALMGSATGAGTGYVVWDDVQVERGDVPTAWNAKVKELLPGTITTAMLQAGSVVIGGSDAVVFAPGYDPSTKATQSDLTNVAEVGRLQDNYLQNSTFDDWPSGNPAPTGYMVNAGTPVRETTLLRTAPTALRFNVLSGVANYIQPTQYPIGNTPFVTVRTDVYLNSGSWGGAGILARWYNTSGGMYDAVVSFSTLLGSSPTGVWWRVETVVPRPSGFSGTFSRLEIWPIGGWTGIGTIAAKEIIFDQLSARPSTTDEIKAWTAGLWAYPGTTTINGGMLQTGTVIADQVQASAINALVEIVGPQFKTASAGERVVMRNDGTGGVVEFYTGVFGETPGKLDPMVSGSTPGLLMQSGKTSEGYVPYIKMWSGGVSVPSQQMGGYVEIAAASSHFRGPNGAFLITDTGAYIGGSPLYLQGKQFGGIMVGISTMSTDPTTAEIVVNHGFGASNYVFTQVVTSTNRHAHITAKDSNSFTLVVRNNSDNSLATAVAWTFYYLIVGVP